jgi:hypothetical protein
MSKKNFFVLALSFLAVAAIYFYFYGDAFRAHHIQISHTFRPSARALQTSTADEEPLRNVVFALDHEYRLTSVKVVAVADYEKNKFAHPVWEMISDSNSPPTRVFNYGTHIHGMHPAEKGTRPGQLDFNVPYRLIVQAGRTDGTHDFTLVEENHIR